MGQLARLRGQITGAKRRCGEAAVALRTDGRTFTPFCFGELAHADALAGDGESSRERLAEAERQRAPGFGLFNYWIDLARPWVLACGGDVAAAVDHALDTASRAHDAGLVGFEIIAAHDALRLGAAERATDRLQAAAARAEGPYPAVCAEHAAAARPPAVALAGANRE